MSDIWERLAAGLGRAARRGMILPVVGICLMTGCSPFDFFFGPIAPDDGSNTALTIAVAVVQPEATVTASPGATTVIQWSDIAKVVGTTVRVSAQRQNSLAEDVGDPIQLIGNGTPGSGRDAIADGNNDVFIWDVTGVRVGDYVITVTLDAPDGTSATAVSRDLNRNTSGIIRVETALLVPTLAFTAPGAADVTVNVGSTFDITWTDNGTANADALLTLGLDTDADHQSGNEIILLRDQTLSTDGNTGQFTFSLVDADGNSVATGTYTVFATIDDHANDIVTKEATGKLILAP